MFFITYRTPLTSPQTPLCINHVMFSQVRDRRQWLPHCVPTSPLDQCIAPCQTVTQTQRTEYAATNNRLASIHRGGGGGGGGEVIERR